MEIESSVLLIEDDISDAALFQALLQEAGLSGDRVEHHDTLEAGLAACRDRPFDVVLLDLNLPDGVGVETVSRFAEQCPNVPVVVLTGDQDMERARDALRLGAEDYLFKGETSHGSLLMRSLGYAIERKRAREEIIRLEKHLFKAQRLESLEVLAGGVAHDFNNQLVGILGNAAMVLADLPKASEVVPLVSEIERSALLASDLTRQLLAYAGKGRFVVGVQDLSELVGETIGLLKASVSANAMLRSDLSPDALPVRIDATQIQQILMNLVTNASEALEGGSGTINVTTGRIEIDDAYSRVLDYNQTLGAGRYAFLEVSDSGIGMDAEVRSRIFDPFFSTKFAGRGLGLAASLGIARGHEGAVRVYSEPGQGTSFKLLLPLAATTEQPADKESKNRPHIADAKQILVVDDNEAARTVARRILARAGLDVLVASNGEEAVRLFATRPSEIDLVLLDMTMPRMDGEETCRQLRAIDPAVKIVMMSGYNEQDVIARLAGRGVMSFIQKPFQPDALLEKIEETLGSD